MKFLKCLHCNTVIHLTEKPKQCECGAVVGAKTGNKTYSFSGNAVSFTIPEECLNFPEGARFVGKISSNDLVKLGKTSTKNENIGVT